MHDVKGGIKIGNSKYLVIDLSQPLSMDTELYPGDPKPERVVFSDIKKSGWHHYVHRVGDHVFQPHADAPNHQNPDMKDAGIEKFGIVYCFNEACMIDLSNQGDEREGVKHIVEVRKEHLEPFYGIISGKGAVIIRTGYDRWLEENRPHVPERIPYLNREAAEYLSSFKGINVVGIDSLSVDPPGRHDSHQILKNMLIVESLVHLHEIPEGSRECFNVQTSPLRIKGATGGPVVAYAFIGLV